MGWEIAEEVQEYAPKSLTWRELYFACVLANVANATTRLCVPGLTTDERLMRKLRITDKREIMRVIERLIEAKVIERTARGHVGQRAEFLFLPLGPARSMDGESTHPSEGGETTHPSDSEGWGNDHKRVGNPPQEGGETTHPFSRSQEDQPLPSPQRIIRDAQLGLTEEEERGFITWANQAIPGGVKGAPWWRKVRDNGDLPGNVERWRQSAPDATARASPRCANPDCVDGWIHDDDLDQLSRCPTCKPERRTP